MARTTEDLRETLFDAIDAVKGGDMEADQAKVIAMLADKVIGTLRVEVDYALAINQLDSSDNGITPGPLLLTGDKRKQIKAP